MGSDTRWVVFRRMLLGFGAHAVLIGWALFQAAMGHFREGAHLLGKPYAYRFGYYGVGFSADFVRGWGLKRRASLQGCHFPRG